MGDNKNAAVFNFGEGDITFGGSVVMGDQVAVSGGVVYGDVVMGSSSKTETTDDE